MRQAADLGRGTGRTGEWLRRHGVASVDGVDLTAEMLARSRERPMDGETTPAALAALPEGMSFADGNTPAAT